MAGSWSPWCVICLLALNTQSPAQTLIDGDAVCTRHARLRVSAEGTAAAIREAERPAGNALR